MQVRHCGADASGFQNRELHKNNKSPQRPWLQIACLAGPPLMACWPNQCPKANHWARNHTCSALGCLLAGSFNSRRLPCLPLKAQPIRSTLPFGLVHNVPQCAAHQHTLGVGPLTKLQLLLDGGHLRCHELPLPGANLELRVEFVFDLQRGPRQAGMLSQSAIRQEQAWDTLARDFTGPANLPLARQSWAAQLAAALQGTGMPVDLARPRPLCREQLKLAAWRHHLHEIQAAAGRPPRSRST